ncbi:MAG: aromatic ring-hydroxylating dioxygenase subunit alpha [Planctomycetota bacterium]
MGQRPFEIDVDICKAWTPPTWVYTDPNVYERIKDRLFARSWQLVCDADRVRVPGQVYPFTLLEGCLDEPLLLARDRSDRLHCYSNVCTHRGHLVCHEPGMEHGLRCRYHGRRFNLDGEFVSMPEFEGVEDFPSEADNLTAVPLGQWGPLLFAGVRPEGSLSEWLKPVKERVAWMPLDEFQFDPSRSRDYLVQANWALYCENYLEGFHIPYVHMGLNEALDYGAYRTELFEHSSLQIGIGQGGVDVFDLPRESPDFGQKIAGYYFWLFPNLMLNFYPWGLSINVVKPLAVDRTRVSFLAYVWKPEKVGSGAGTELDRVEREDELVVEAVQRGVRARLYERGRYSPSRETGTHHFHRMLAARLQE